MSVPEKIVVSGVDITRDVWTELADIFEDQLNRAEGEQIALMEAEERVTQGQGRKDLPFGRISMKVCKEVYDFWADKLGDQCWTDKAFLKWCKNRHGNLVKVKSRSAKIVV